MSPLNVSIAQRRSSLAKLHNLPLEAPITRVITLLTNAMTETSATNPEIAMQIDKVLGITRGRFGFDEIEKSVSPIVNGIHLVSGDRDPEDNRVVRTAVKGRRQDLQRSSGN